MSVCIKCGKFTKHSGGLCYQCYKNNGNTHYDDCSDASNNETFEQKGLSDKDRNFRYGMIKGRIAETLIQELFLSLGYNVFRYGMENTIPGIVDLLKGDNSDVAQEIRRMPDFVVQNPKTKAVHFIEVKFRAKGEFKHNDLPKNYPYENAYILLVSKKHIKCITVPELKAGKEVTPTSNNYLGSRKEFGLDKEIIKDFCEFAVKFFENV